MEHTNDFIELCNSTKLQINEISIDEAEDLLHSVVPPVLIDVRDADEFTTGHLPNAKHISKGWIEAKINTAVPNKETAVILYCGGGNRSALAAYNLQKMGYKHVLSMAGGFKEWKNAHKKVTTPNQTG